MPTNVELAAQLQQLQVELQDQRVRHAQERAEDQAKHELHDQQLARVEAELVAVQEKNSGLEKQVQLLTRTTQRTTPLTASEDSSLRPKTDKRSLYSGNRDTVWLCPFAFMTTVDFDLKDFDPYRRVDLMYPYLTAEAAVWHARLIGDRAKVTNEPLPWKEYRKAFLVEFAGSRWSWDAWDKLQDIRRQRQDQSVRAYISEIQGLLHILDFSDDPALKIHSPVNWIFHKMLVHVQRALTPYRQQLLTLSELVSKAEELGVALPRDAGVPLRSVLPSRAGGSHTTHAGPSPARTSAVPTFQSRPAFANAAQAVHDRDVVDNGDSDVVEYSYVPSGGAHASYGHALAYPPPTRFFEVLDHSAPSQ